MTENLSQTETYRKLSVLITGGSGLVGRHLTSVLLAEGYEVNHLSRESGSAGKVRTYMWQPSKGIIDGEALKGTDYIVHLAGANLGEKRWTAARKEEIIKSRTESAILLHRKVMELGIGLKAFVSSSAIGYYGTVTSEKIFSENDAPGNGFLSDVCRKWEDVADLFEGSGIRTVKIRTAVVLEKTEGALAKLMEPARFGMLIMTGSGDQYMPWIHIDDLCGIYLKAIKDSKMSGAYNAAAPEFINHRNFMKVLSGILKKPVSPVSAPAFVLKAVLGEMSDMVLKGSRVSPEKLISSGYRFRFSNLEETLRSVIN